MLGPTTSMLLVYTRNCVPVCTQASITFFVPGEAGCVSKLKLPPSVPFPFPSPIWMKAYGSLPQAQGKPHRLARAGLLLQGQECTQGLTQENHRGQGQSGGRDTNSYDQAMGRYYVHY